MADHAMTDVAELLERLPFLGRGELMALAGAQGPGAGARRAAWRSVEAVAGARDGGRMLDRLRGEVAAWATRLGSIVGDEAGTGLADLRLAELRRAAAPTVLDAAVALMLWEDLSDADRTALLAPWQSVMSPRRPSPRRASPRRRLTR